MQIKVLQWNVWFRENIDRVVDVIKDLDVDVVCLQELTQGYIEQTQENTWEHIQNELNFDCVHQTIPISTEAAQWMQANAIFSRYPLHGQRNHWLHVPKDTDDRADQYRGYLEAEVQIENTLITVATTHMSFQKYLTGNDHELQKLLDLTENRSKKFILTGDFNVTPDSKRIQELDKRFQHAGPTYSDNTWTTKPHKTPEFEASTLSWRYDYVFTTHDFEILDAKTIETDVSDHLPVLVTLKIPGN